MLDRLALTPARLKGIADDVRQVCNLADPVGQVIDGGVLDSGLRLERRRVPLGVIGVIYEARPNVTVDVAYSGRPEILWLTGGCRAGD